MRAIYFDMDGTIADLYAVDNWLEYLITGKTKPYREADPMINMRTLGKVLNALQNDGYHIGIVSWLSKSGTEDYNKRVTATKINWLKKHLGAVDFDEIVIVPYGTSKSSVVKYPSGVLFDDEKNNRINWRENGLAFDEKYIIDVLQSMIEK